MTRVLLDTNVVLDVLLQREPFVADSARIWEAADAGAFDACVAAFSLPTIHYICGKQTTAARALAAVDLCLEAFEVVPLYRETIIAARRMPGEDFEDNLQMASAVTDFAQGIVTRDRDHFRQSPVRVYTPAEFLAVLR